MKQSFIYKCQHDDASEIDIIMLAYNHGEYIEKAIKSILMQKTSYLFKIKIGEDCSTDTTRQIVMDYYERYPDKIELILWKKNVGRKRNHMELAKKCKGKYIAYLEGDDYWTDPLKLEKQITFLEKHKEYIGTVHNVRCVDREGKLLHRDFSLYPICEEHIYGKEQAEKFEMAGQTASLLFRNIWKDWTQERLESLFLCEGNNDVKINMLLGMIGDVYCFKDIMADHRRVFHGDSWTANSHNKNMLWFRFSLCSTMKKYLEQNVGVSLDTDTIFQLLCEESVIKLLCDYNKENLNVWWQFFKRRILKGE